MRKIGVFLILIAAIGLAYFILTYDPAPTPDASSTMPADAATDRPADDGTARIRLATWNLLNFGKSKDAGEVTFIADVLRDFDVVALQEINTGPDGAQAVARLDEELERRGAQWDYIVSQPTSGDGSERYAYLWKPSRVRILGRGWLEASVAGPLDREPYLARFETRQGGRQLLVASFHAVPRAKRPADEVAYLDELHRRYEADNLLILGDFNLAQDHYAFDELKALGYQPVLVEQKTSIRMRRKDGEHLANEYDNIFYDTTALRAGASGVVDFTGEFRTLRQARTISDHLPVFMQVEWK
jgi:endonuclease/exonuclease/phosphatase family metal-dependent hydrolase